MSDHQGIASSSGKTSFVVTVTTISGVASLLATVFAVVFLLLPNLKPEADYQQIEGSLTNITWRQAVNGVIGYDVKASILGLRGSTCRLAYSVYDASARYTGIASTDALELTPERDQDAAGGTVAVPQPNLPGQYYVLFTLLAPNGTKLDTKRSQNFTVY